MKKIILILAFVLLNAIFIFGQERDIDREKFNRAQEAAAEKLDGKTFRTITIVETLKDPNAVPTRISKSIIETIPPDRERWIFENDKVKKEVIQIADRRYERLNGGDWKEADEVFLSTMGSGCTASLESESYKITENSRLDGKTVDVYEMKRKYSSSDCDENDQAEIWRYRFWITKDGLFLKTEDERQNLGTKFIHRNTIIYKYDSNIKIESPVIKKSKQ